MDATFCELDGFEDDLADCFGRGERADAEYRDLQAFLMAAPTTGVVIPGAGGLRKIRWAAPGRGKRGGIRVIYLYVPEAMTFLMVAAYAKNDIIDLTPDERTALAGYAEDFAEKARRQVHRGNPRRQEQ